MVAPKPDSAPTQPELMLVPPIWPRFINHAEPPAVPWLAVMVPVIGNDPLAPVTCAGLAEVKISVPDELMIAVAKHCTPAHDPDPVNENAVVPAPWLNVKLASAGAGASAASNANARSHFILFAPVGAVVARLGLGSRQ